MKGKQIIKMQINELLFTKFVYVYFLIKFIKYKINDEEQNK